MAKFWTDEKVEWFRAYVPGHTEREISAEHERLYGTPLSESQIGNGKRRFKVLSGTHGGQFEKGHPPANKGKTWSEYGTEEGHEKSRATCFRKGRTPHNVRELLSERRDKDGYWFVKVKPRDAKHTNHYWIAKARFEWEKAHCQVVPDDCTVMFADRNTENFDPDNLVLVKKKSKGIIAKSYPHYHDAETLKVCEALADLTRAINERKDK